MKVERLKDDPNMKQFKNSTAGTFPTKSHGYPYMWKCTQNPQNKKIQNLTQTVRVQQLENYTY